MNKEEINEFIKGRLKGIAPIDFEGGKGIKEAANFFYLKVAPALNDFFIENLNLKGEILPKVRFSTDYSVQYSSDKYERINLVGAYYSEPYLEYNFSLLADKSLEVAGDRRRFLSRKIKEKLSIESKDNLGLAVDSPEQGPELISIRRRFFYFPSSCLKNVPEQRVLSEPDKYLTEILTECKAIYGVFKPLADKLETNFPRFGGIFAKKNAEDERHRTKLKELSDKLLE